MHGGTGWVGINGCLINVPEAKALDTVIVTTFTHGKLRLSG